MLHPYCVLKKASSLEARESFHRACRDGQAVVVNLMLKCAGASKQFLIRHVDDKSGNSMDVARANAHESVCELLRQHGAAASMTAQPLPVSMHSERCNLFSLLCASFVGFDCLLRVPNQGPLREVAQKAPPGTSAG